MKNKLILASLFVAIASYGGNIVLAHAQSLTPDQTAALQQQLDVAKAQLVQLQMQAGQVPGGDNTLPTMTAPAASQATALSASDVAAMNTALGQLANVLIGIEAKITADPTFVSTNGPTLAATIKTIGATVVTIATQIHNSNIAMMTPAPAAPIAVGTPAVQAPTVAITPTTPAPAATTPAATTPAATTPVVNTAPLSAQTAASSFSFSSLNWPLIIVIILIVAAIAIWLWWDGDEEVKRPVVKQSSPQPQKPVVTVQTMNQNTGGNAPARPQTSVQTPLSSAVSPQQGR